MDLRLIEFWVSLNSKSLKIQLPHMYILACKPKVLYADFTSISWYMATYATHNVLMSS